MRCFAARRRVAAVAIGFAAVLVAGPAAADDKNVCATAYDDTQSLKKAGRLHDAREQAALCVRTVCPSFMRVDCARWLGEIEAAEPSVVFEVKDAHGADTTAVRVTLDGKPWLTELDGQAKLIDPGRHTLRFELPDASSKDEDLVVREQEKGRLVQVLFDGAAPTTPSTPSPSIAPWILGGVGVALAGAGVAMGVVVLGAKSDVDKLCPGAVCPSDDVKSQADGSRSTVNTLGPISTTAMALGGVAIGAAVVWLVVRKPAQIRATGVVPMFGPGAAGASLRGVF
ncbi:MAG TPA: hypothetical protein VGM56_00835 [Byssovorax sp.]|jgi:hypothetical protein